MAAGWRRKARCSVEQTPGRGQTRRLATIAGRYHSRTDGNASVARLQRCAGRPVVVLSDRNGELYQSTTSPFSKRIQDGPYSQRSSRISMGSPSMVRTFSCDMPNASIGKAGVSGTSVELWAMYGMWLISGANGSGSVHQNNAATTDTANRIVILEGPRRDSRVGPSGGSVDRRVGSDTLIRTSSACAPGRRP